MNRLKAVGVLVALGSIAIVTVLTSPAMRATSLPALSTQHVGRSSRLLAAASDITCVVNITTTSSISNNYTPETAAFVASYGGLALVPPTYVSPTQVVLAPAVDNWFVLANATRNYEYTFEAVPDFAGNYNIGMEVYAYSPGTDTLLFQNIDTADGTSARIVARFAGVGPYFIRIFQISNYCSGGTYHLNYTYRKLIPPPGEFGYGMVMAGPDNSWPDVIDFHYQLVLTSPVSSGSNKLLRLAVDAADLNDLSAMQHRVSQLVSASGATEVFQIGNDPNLSSSWNAPPNAVDYSQALCAAYQSVKQTRPWAQVVSGGLTTTGRVAGTWNGHLGHNGSQQDEREFLKEFITAGGGNCLDALGYNTLGFGNNYDAIPDVNGGTPGTNCADGRCFRSVEKAHIIMESHGLDKPIWITGVGWLTSPPSSCLSDSRWQGRTGQIVTSARQSANLVGAFRYARFQWPWLKAMFVFNLDFNLAPWYDECDPVRYYSVAGQPAFLALGAMSKEVYHLYVPMIKQ
jgi:hypothetical protein